MAISAKSVHLFKYCINKKINKLGLKSSRPLSQLGPGSTRPESTHARIQKNLSEGVQLLSEGVDGSGSTRP